VAGIVAPYVARSLDDSLRTGLEIQQRAPTFAFQRLIRSLYICKFSGYIGAAFAYAVGKYQYRLKSRRGRRGADCALRLPGTAIVEVGHGQFKAFRCRPVLAADRVAGSS
jgi:hypothetical protein